MSTPDEQIAVKEILKDIRSPTIVELGARLGEDYRWICWEACAELPHYVMVEADIRNCQHILDNTHMDAHTRLIVGAVAAYNGTIEFMGSVSDGGATRGSGSIRDPKMHQQVFPDIEFPEELHTRVPCYTLDEIFKREWLTKIDLLWVDIQGAEADMLVGGLTALRHTRFLFIETEPRELYEGMLTKHDLLKELDGIGFKLLRDFDYNCLLENTEYRGPAPARR